MRLWIHLCAVLILCASMPLFAQAGNETREPNLLTSFEGTLEGWALQLNRGARAELVFDKDTGALGNTSLRIKPTLLCAPDDKPYPTNIHLRYERFAMEPGFTYLLSAWVRADSKSRTFYLGARRADEAAGIGQACFDASEVWRRYEVVMRVNETVPDAMLQIIAGADTRPLWVDAVTFRKDALKSMMPAGRLAFDHAWAEPSAWQREGIAADPKVPEVRIGPLDLLSASLPATFRFDLMVDMGGGGGVFAGLATERGQDGPALGAVAARDGVGLGSWTPAKKEIVVSERRSAAWLPARWAPIRIERRDGRVHVRLGEMTSLEVARSDAGLDRLCLGAFGPQGGTLLLKWAEGYELLSPERPDGSCEKMEYRDAETGARIVRLTHSVYNDKHAYYDVSPWSPDGSRIVFSSALPRTQAATVYTMKADGTDIRKAAEGRTFGMHCGDFPVWAADGKSIYFHTRFQVGEEWRLGTARVFLDSGKVDYLPVSVRQVSWATGRLLEPVSDSNAETRGLFSYAPDGSDKKLLASMEQIAALSPNREKLQGLRLNLQNSKWNSGGAKAFVVFCGRNEKKKSLVTEVYVVNADGSDLHFATAMNHHPIWHPNGRQIIYNGADGLYLVNADGSDNHKISDCGQGHPSYSPDGRMIVTDGYGGEFRDKLILIDPETGAWRVLCNVPTVHGRSHETGTHPHPFWAPDGKSVLYDSDQTGLCQLYQVFLD